MKDISVVMPVYNAEAYIEESITSVLNQSFDDFEFIIIDDGSTDTTLERIKAFDDSRIKLIQNQHDFIRSLNIGFENATGRYIARMDADDIMHVDRLRIQFAVMEEEPDIAVCGTLMSIFGKGNPPHIPSRQGGFIDVPLIHFLHGNFISHPTTMIRKDFLQESQCTYQDGYALAEDYKLWVEMAKRGGVFYIEPQVLLNYRQAGLIDEEKAAIQAASSIRIQAELLEYLCLLNPTVQTLQQAMDELQKKGLISFGEALDFWSRLFFQNRKQLSFSAMEL
jgi:glycosyltransferase involved in cell wall biosynthesis